MNRHFNKRAVSQIIAALLLIAIAVAAAVLLYVFSIGLLGSLGSGGGQQTKEQVIMEAYSWPAGGTLTMTVRDVGPSSATIGTADFFVNGLAATGSCVVQTLTPQEATSCSLTGLTGSSYTSGVAYVLKVVTPEGGVFSYNVVDGSSS